MNGWRLKKKANRDKRMEVKEERMNTRKKWMHSVA